MATSPKAEASGSILGRLREKLGSQSSNKLFDIKGNEIGSLEDGKMELGGKVVSTPFSIDDEADA